MPFVPPSLYVASPFARSTPSPPARVASVTVSDEDVREKVVPVPKEDAPAPRPRSTQGLLGFAAYARGRVAIRRSPSSKSARLYTMTNRQLVVAAPYNEDWMKIVMTNGRSYYASRTGLEMTSFAVTRANARGSVASRSAGGRTRGTGREALVGYSYNFIGTPYVWGGNDLQRGIDCSGFVKKLYGAIGLNLPRTAAEQARVGLPITRLQDLRAGDRLYFWEDKRGKIGHTGMYTGNGYFVHSSTGHSGVATDYLTSRWLKILVAARR